MGIPLQTEDQWLFLPLLSCFCIDLDTDHYPYSLVGSSCPLCLVSLLTWTQVTILIHSSVLPHLKESQQLDSCKLPDFFAFFPISLSPPPTFFSLFCFCFILICFHWIILPQRTRKPELGQRFNSVALVLYWFHGNLRIFSCL